jgi:hypothetical protein
MQLASRLSEVVFQIVFWAANMAGLLSDVGWYESGAKRACKATSR